MKNLTFEQASSLFKQGIISAEAFNEMINSGNVEVFRFRGLSEDKPEDVHAVHEAMLRVVKANSAVLLAANYKPSINWTKIDKDLA